MSTPSVSRRTGSRDSRSRAGGRSGSRLRTVLGAGLSACVAFAGIITGPTTAMAATDTNPEFRLTKGDLEFILKQIKISEAHAEAVHTGDTSYSLLCDDPADTSWTCVPDPKLSYGLRTVDGSFNNIETDERKYYGAAGQVFPRLAPAAFAAADSYDPDGPNGPAPLLNTSYTQKNGYVVDYDPRMISNLIADQTVRNPAAMAMLETVEGSYTFDHDGDGFVWESFKNGEPFNGITYDPAAKLPGTPDRVFIPNVSPDVGLSAPFTGWFTLFGQFFDHGLDLVGKGGNGQILLPYGPDDELYIPGSRTNFIPVTRATNLPGLDGVLGTPDDVQEHVNKTTPFIDQNQTYTSHPSHQAFLREYELVHGRPVPTGHLLDGAKGGPPTWAEVKDHVKNVLGIQLDDMDAVAVPLLVMDPYGRFVPGPTGFPQLIVPGPEGPTNLEGSIASPVDATQANDAGVAFLDDIAHGAEPKADGSHNVALLESHYLTGDGRGNENIGLTAVHHIFHSEHNRVADHVKVVLEASGDADLIAAYKSEDGVWDYGERVFQAARLVTEMEYQHLVFEEFVRSIQPNIDAGPLNETLYHSDLDPALTAEFAHVVYRFGHSMLTVDVDRSGFGTESLSLFDAFLNPAEFTDNGRLSPDEGAAAVLQGMAGQTGNGIDEFVDGTLRNQLLGVGLDLAAINIARARDTGMPGLQRMRKVFYDQTLDSSLKPYASWQTFELGLKNRATVVNFIAAYSGHPTIASAVGIDAKREAAAALRADPAFMAGNTGLDAIDFWTGGLAERPMDFGGMLGSTFNAVFEGHMEALQNGDRFYYLNRVIGTNLITQLEGNSFSELAMRNTDASLLNHNVFANPTLTFDLNNLPSPLPANLLQLPDGTIRFDGEDHINIHGTDGDDRIEAGIGDDSVWGHDGKDALEGGSGNDVVVGGHGGDKINDLFGDDVLHGGDGNDAINAGSGLDLIFGGFGKDFILHGQDATQSFAGGGTDFLRGGNAPDIMTGNEDDDWLEGGDLTDLVQGDNALTFQNDPNGGADVLMGNRGPDDHDAEGGDDIMDNNGTDRHAGMLGFDWVGHKYDSLAANADLGITVFQPPTVTLSKSRFANVEGLSGWTRNDILRGSSKPGDPALVSGAGHELTQAHLDRVKGLRELLGGGAVPRYATPFMATDAGNADNIVLGGAGSDIIEGRGGDDYIDGDAALDVFIEWRPAGGAVERQETMQGFASRVFAGTIDPGDLHIVRAVVDQETDDTVIDTAVYADVQSAHTLTNNGDGTWTVTHNDADAVVGLASGADILRNIEWVKFGDAVPIDLATLAAADRAASGTVNLSTTSPAENVALSVVLDPANPSFTDPDGIDYSTVTYTWQWMDDEGAWTDSVSGTGAITFTPGDVEAGRALRVVASFTDGAEPGNQESIASAATLPVANVNDAPTGYTLSTTSPAVGGPVTFSGLVDPDGTHDADGALAVDFRYQWQQSNGTSWQNISGATADTFTPTDTQVNRRLRVRVVYTDLRGTVETVTSAATAPVGSTATEPGAPVLGAVTGGHAKATVNWTAPSTTGGIDLLSYAVEVQDVDGARVGPLRYAAPDATSLVVDGLVNGTTYRFQVQAANLVGGGAFSALSAGVTPVSATPGQPTIGAAVGGDKSATVNWEAPAVTGGSAITKYEIQVINAGGVLTLRDLPVGTSHQVTALTNGTPYTFTVRALNADGPGPWSAASNEVTPSVLLPVPVEPALSGVVGTPSGGLADATVHVYLADTLTWKGSVTSGPDGTYRFEELPAGSYKLWIQPNEPGFSNQWHGGVSFETADPITVDVGTTQDVTLAGTYRLSGVVGPAGGGLSGATVHVYLADSLTWKGAATSTADGSYVFPALPEGSYKVWVQPNEAGFVNQWHGGSSFTTAATITVDRSTTQNITLTGTYTLSGVVGPTGAGLEGATVHVYLADTLAWKGSVTSGAGGSYSFASLPAGTYKVWVQPNEAGFANQWHGGTSFQTAGVIQVSGATTQNITLTGTYTLSGVVGPTGAGLEGATVHVYLADTLAWKGSVTSGAGGSYSLASLPAGTYKVWVQPNEAGFANQWHGGVSFETASRIGVSANTTQNITLTGTFRLSGAVSTAGGTLEGATVHVYTADTMTWKGSASSGADGAYSFAALPAGTYRLWVQPNEAGFANQWHGGTSFNTATDVGLSTNTTANVTLVG